MFLIFRKYVCVFIFTVIAHKDMFDAVISGVPWQQEPFYHQPIDTTWWVRASPTLPSPLFSRLKSTELSQFGRRKKIMKKREKSSYQFSSRTLLVSPEVWVPSSSKSTCAYVLAVKCSHGRAFTGLCLFCWVLAQVNHDTLKAWWFGLGDGSCGLHYWRSPLKSQLCQDRPESLII